LLIYIFLNIDVYDGGLEEQRKTEQVPTPGKDTKFQWPSWTGVAQAPFCLGLKNVLTLLNINRY
jgi:hypothetical protein